MAGVLDLADLERIARAAKRLDDFDRQQQETRVALLGLQQTMAELLAQLEKHGLVMAQAVRDGLASAKPPQVNMPAPSAPPPPHGWDVEVDTHSDGRLRSLKFMPRAPDEAARAPRH